MLIAGASDGIYVTRSLEAQTEPDFEHVLDIDEVYRIYHCDHIGGLLATSESGLFHTTDGMEWAALPLPQDQVYAISETPAGDRLYAGTRPAHLYTTSTESGVPVSSSDWDPVGGFEALRNRTDWGIPRHDGISQIRSIATHDNAPDRIAVGVEVGGVFVSDDRGSTWMSRRIEGFDAPHTDDIHHLLLEDDTTMVASTGSGLFRSTDLGRTWHRLDDGHRQRYFREAFEHDGISYAGAAPASSTSWNDDTDHALFECRDGRSLEMVDSPVPDEVVVGWCTAEGSVIASTHRGSILVRENGNWHAVASLPDGADVLHRYLPLTWYEP